MSVIHAPRRPTVDFRLMIFPIACGAFLLVLFLRLWYFQVVMAADLTERASRTRPLTVNVLAPRGRILDRNAQLIAGVRPEVVVTAIPIVLNKHPAVLDKVAAILNVKREQLDAKLPHVTPALMSSVADVFGVPTIKTDVNLPLAPIRLPVPIFVGATEKQAAEIDESPIELPGISVMTQPMRFYSDPVDASHLLGNVWTPDAQQLDRLKSYGVPVEDVPEYVGKNGIEYTYERMLMGVHGTEQVITDAKHQPLRVIGRDVAVPGAELTLSIDMSLQKLATKELAGRKGAVVAIDPATGEVLCMVSTPGFSLEDFENGAAYVDDPNSTTENRGISGFYAPGSTFKIVTSLAMFETGNFDINSTVFCDGAYHMSKKARIRCLGVHRNISYMKALADSCNTYFCTMGVRAGPEALAKAAREFGLGEAPDVDLRGGDSPRIRGLIPDPAYFESHRLGHWYTGNTANTAIGQGDVLTSPLQMADVAAMVANRGVMYRPHLLHSIRSAGSTQPVVTKPEVAHAISASDYFWDTLVEGLHGVIETGTGSACKIPGVPWAGKTGSAEHKLAEKTHSWFVGFAPLDHPRIAIAVLVESAGHGSTVAAPIAQHVVEGYLSPPRPVSTSDNSAASASARAASSGRP